MRTRALGDTGLQVSELGLGAGPLGGNELDDAAAVRLIHAAIDRGVTLIDTAPSYGRSEIRIGEALRGRRERVVLSTKLGYGVPGVPDWTGACITGGVDAALARMGVDRIDIAHLHSCPCEVLERTDVIDALEHAVRAGKVRVAAYSGDNLALRFAIESGRFGVVQCSVSVADQRALDWLPARGIGVLAKRTLANGAWRLGEQPREPDRAEYWRRFRALGLTLDAAYLLRFVLAEPRVSSALVGTTSVANLDALCAAAEAGPLPPDEVARAREAFRREDRGWDGVV